MTAPSIKEQTWGKEIADLDNARPVPLRPLGPSEHVRIVHGIAVPVMPDGSRLPFLCAGANPGPVK